MLGANVLICLQAWANSLIWMQTWAYILIGMQNRADSLIWMAPIFVDTIFERMPTSDTDAPRISGTSVLPPIFSARHSPKNTYKYTHAHLETSTIVRRYLTHAHITWWPRGFRLHQKLFYFRPAVAVFQQGNLSIQRDESCLTNRNTIK